VEKKATKGFIMAKKKRIEVGWIVMWKTVRGNWCPILYTQEYTRSLAIAKCGAERYKKGRRAGTLKVKKMEVTM